MVSVVLKASDVLIPLSFCVLVLSELAVSLAPSQAVIVNENAFSVSLTSFKWVFKKKHF